MTLKRFITLASVVVACTLVPVVAAAQTQVKPRFLVIQDTSGSMVLTPEVFDLGGFFDGLPTHGDGTNENPGCNLDGDTDPTTGYAFNDSRMYVAEAALGQVFSSFGEVEFALERFHQIAGGQTCTTAANCPKGPGMSGPDTITIFQCVGGRCVVDPSQTDPAPNFTGDCYPINYNECEASWTCSQCPAGTDRNTCNAYKSDATCQGDTAPFGSGTVSCANAAGDVTGTSARGAYGVNGDPTACYLADGEVLVGFPASPLADNYTQLMDWIDHDTTDGSELRAQGATPLAGSLQSAKTYLQGIIAGDTFAACRSYNVILITDGQETCNGDAAAAATALTNTLGVNVKTYVVALALCPAANPNCAAKAPLDAIAAAGGTGTAIGAVDQVQLASALSTIIQGSIKNELCNGADDNCNNVVDEGFPNKGMTCTAGQGACARTGVFVCDANGLGTHCSVTPGAPSPEVCNNIDDDCNGLVDDGIVCTPCTPQSEVCDNKDNNCNGQVDEGITPVSCGTDTGECVAGTTQCMPGGVTVCVGSVGPQPEACNNKDDDCDGFVDGFSQACYDFASGCNVGTGVCLGICQTGLKTCTAGAFGSCVGEVGPQTEIPCNGLDDDCDGLVDENTGVEVCDGVDNDCDGLVDEGPLPAPIGQSCGTPPFTPPCAAGTLQCVAGVPTCVGEKDPQAEACDGVDNDCDGVIDDGNPGGGAACGINTGDCQAGVLTCTSGTLGCSGEVGPALERCDCHDNDCDGQTDESDPMLGDQCNTLPGGGTLNTEVGECQFGVLTCSPSACALTCTGIIGPAPELCDGKDNDCDGMTDEDFPLGAACDNGQLGACKFTGVSVCAPSGMGTVCTAPPGTPGIEQCNGIDDDCDGLVDEDPLPLVGTACGPPMGACAPPHWECQMGNLVCVGAGTGGVEVCNGIDDNCNQLIDEPPVPGTGVACTDPGFETIGDTGECAFGQTICSNGAITCDGYKGPQPEICNGKDDDCDGNPDNSASCPDPSNVCYMGACVVPCGTGEFPCPSGFTCETLPEGRFCVADPCFNVNCPAGQGCDQMTGQCVDLCATVNCTDGKSCVQGACVDCFDPRIPCMDGFICVADQNGVGQCQADPCPPGHCAMDQICKDGNCIHDCTGECPAGGRCNLDTGNCENDPCASVTCPSGQLCDPADGMCKNDNCLVVHCNPGEVCVPQSGQCVPDPCATVDCPTGLHCEVDFGGQPQCVSNTPPPPPGSHEQVLATGGGGCACQAGGHASHGAGAPAALALFGVSLVIVRRRNRKAGGR